MRKPAFKLLPLLLLALLLLALTPRALAASPFPAYKAPPTLTPTQRMFRPGYIIAGVYLFVQTYLSDRIRNARRERRGLPPIEPIWRGMTLEWIVSLFICISYYPFIKLIAYLFRSVAKTPFVSKLLLSIILAYFFVPPVILAIYRRKQDRAEQSENICVVCGKDNPLDAEVCEKCGFGLTPPLRASKGGAEKQRKQYTRTERILICLIAILLSVLFYLLLRNK